MFRLAGLYIVGAWVVIQVAEALFLAWGIPETANRFVFIAAALCFPIVLVFGWVYDVTSSGIVRTRPATEGEQIDLRLKLTDYVILAALVVIAVIIVAGSVGRITEQVEDFAQTAARLENSVAVMPFTNLDMNPETGFFSDGVSEEILHRLSTLRSVNVLGRTSSFGFRNASDGPARIAEILGVQYLLQGSVRRDANFVRVTASLVDDTGLQVWSQTFDRELEGIFSIQSEIANTVASEILNEIVPFEQLPAGRTTSNIEAYNEFFIGKAFYNRRTPGWQNDAAAAFQRAIVLDDGFAPAYAGLAIAKYIGEFTENLDEARAAMRRALELDPDLADALAIHGLYLHEQENDSEAAIAALRRAIDLDPSFVQAYNWLAIALGDNGRRDEARVVQERGPAIDPLNPPLVVNVATALAVGGEPDRARDLMTRLLYLPQPPGIVYWELLDLEFGQGRHDEALFWCLEIVRAYADTGNHIGLAALAWEFQRLGMSEDADYWMSVHNDIEPDPVARMTRTMYLSRLRGEYDTMWAMATELGMPPESAWPHLDEFMAGILTSLHVATGQYETAVRLFEAGHSPDIDEFSEELNTRNAADFLHNLVIAYQRTGREQQASELLRNVRDALEADSTIDYPPIVMRLAHNYLLSGDADTAVATLRRAFELGYSDYNWIVTEPTWDVAAGLPAFKELLDDMKAEIQRQRAHAESVHDRETFRSEVAARLAN